jgi:hypothetical protein
MRVKPFAAAAVAALALTTFAACSSDDDDDVNLEEDGTIPEGTLSIEVEETTPTS